MTGSSDWLGDALREEGRWHVEHYRVADFDYRGRPTPSDWRFDLLIRKPLHRSHLIIRAGRWRLRVVYYWRL